MRYQNFSDAWMRRAVLSFAVFFLGALISLASADTLECRMSHPGGHREHAIIKTDQAGQVAALYWHYQRRNGQFCLFDPSGATWADFEKLRLASGCVVHFWRQGSRITVALETDTCRANCSSKESLEAVLPVAFDESTRQCAMK